MQTKLILGGPGAGKTTRLLDIIEEEILRGTMPERIAFVSFTRAAVREAKYRAHKRFGLKDSRLPYFRTLHSLCFSKIGLRTSSILTTQDYKLIGTSLGVEVKAGTASPDGSTAMRDGDRMIHMEHISRATGRSLRDVWYEQGSPFSYELLEQFILTTKEYKHRYRKCDFTDMLEIFAQRGYALPLDVAIIDEAQDLTRLEWQVADLAFGNVARRYIAGDDDQAIYTWSGADVAQFLMVQHNEVEILPKSNRLPRKIFEFADTFIRSCVKDRFVKDWTHAGREGKVRFIAAITEVSLDSGSWYLLARNSCFLKKYTRHLQDLGMVYTNRNSYSLNPEHITAIREYERWRGRVEIPRKEARAITKYINHDYKTLPDSCNINDFADESIPWFKALDIIDAMTRIYYRKVLKRYHGFPKEALVYVDTIHSVKGGEADNVVLQTDLTVRTKDTLLAKEEDECRVFYVGATRAKKNLYIMYPESNLSFDLFSQIRSTDASTED